MLAASYPRSMNTSTAASRRDSREFPGRPRRATLVISTADIGSLPRGAPLLGRWRSLRCSRPCPLTTVAEPLELPDRTRQALRLHHDDLQAGAHGVLDRGGHLGRGRRTALGRAVRPRLDLDGEVVHASA